MTLTLSSPLANSNLSIQALQPDKLQRIDVKKHQTEGLALNNKRRVHIVKFMSYAKKN